MNITATKLYNYIKCPHRVFRDAFDDPSLKDPPNDFVQLLWENGIAHEKDMIELKKGEGEILDLSVIPVEARFERTIKAMNEKKPLIYQGRLEVDNLVGNPDLLQLQENGEYVPIDIKSGMGYRESDTSEDVKLKKEYAVQIAFYVDVLNKLGFLSKNYGVILNSQGVEVEYDLSLAMSSRNPMTWWNFYLNIFNTVNSLYNKSLVTEPALGSVCKLCDWATDCKKKCVESNCITLVPELGRSRKDALNVCFKDIDSLADCSMDRFLELKEQYVFNRIGQGTFKSFKVRAELQKAKAKDPLITGEFTFPIKPVELFFDIETDPTQNIVYLHGVVERKDGRKTFRSFVAKDVSDDEEKRAWNEFWRYIRGFDEDQWAMYYYSKYERTQFRHLAKKYPDVASQADVEWLFDPKRSIDLYYDIVKKHTEWPTYNYSVKTLAQHLGFNWRDKNPSGAASIQWFNDWCETKDDKVLQRILDYNEDDCIAMIVVKDKLKSLITEH
ncbi:MAG: TM0106 family RecB-like putative nuclease [Cyclobacteriaceae bacterium]|nr:TM0106 family RecB-like putative nuclease [Cyclobacteriaceae bacterium]